MLSFSDFLEVLKVREKQEKPPWPMNGVEGTPIVVLSGVTTGELQPLVVFFAFRKTKGKKCVNRHKSSTTSVAFEPKSLRILDFCNGFAMRTEKTSLRSLENKCTRVMCFALFTL